MFFASIAPVPFMNVAKVTEMITESGWDFVSMVGIGVVVPRKTVLAGINGGNQEAIPAIMLMFCKEGMEGEIPFFPKINIDEL